MISSATPPDRAWQPGGAQTFSPSALCPVAAAAAAGGSAPAAASVNRVRRVLGGGGRAEVRLDDCTDARAVSAPAAHGTCIHEGVRWGAVGVWVCVCVWGCGGSPWAAHPDGVRLYPEVFHVGPRELPNEHTAGRLSRFWGLSAGSAHRCIRIRPGEGVGLRRMTPPGPEGIVKQQLDDAAPEA